MDSHVMIEYIRYGVKGRETPRLRGKKGESSVKAGKNLLLSRLPPAHPFQEGNHTIRGDRSEGENLAIGSRRPSAWQLEQTSEVEMQQRGECLRFTRDVRSIPWARWMGSTF
jgi:hypothetical protein